MLKSNLRVLLAERNLKITRVATDTGISRTTLTALSSNSSKMVQFDTINALCLRLKVTPAELFAYSPIDFSATFAVDDEHPESKGVGDPYEGTLDWIVSSVTGDLYLKINRGWGTEDQTLELRFSVSPFSIEEAFTQQSGSNLIDVDITDDDSGQLSALWNANELGEFYDVFEQQIRDEFSKQVVPTLLNVIEDANGVLNFEGEPVVSFELQLPVLPY